MNNIKENKYILKTKIEHIELNPARKILIACKCESNSNNEEHK